MLYLWRCARVYFVVNAFKQETLEQVEERLFILLFIFIMQYTVGYKIQQKE